MINPAPTVPDSYLALVRRFPLKSIRSEAELPEAQRLLDELLQREINEGEEFYIDALTDLIETFETKQYSFVNMPAPEMIQALLDMNGLTSGELADDIGIDPARLATILAGSRELTRDQMIRLGKRFHFDPGIFLG